MRLGIDPKIDCVFKKLFGSEKNQNLLLDLVNAVLQEAGQEPVVALSILNPYNDKSFLHDKLSIVDIKARDQRGQWLAIEVQIWVPAYFPKRLLYYWAKLYQSQLQASERYDHLQKAMLICFTAEDLPIGTQNYYNMYKVLNVRDHRTFCEDLCLFSIELSKFLR